MKGEYIINKQLEAMSDGGMKYKSGALDDELRKFAATKQRDPSAKHEDPDINKAYDLIESYDRWDYQIQVMNGMATERLTGHLLKYKNHRARLIEMGEDFWVKSQLKLRDLPSTYGPNAGEAEQLLTEEFKKLVSRKVTNSIRPNRLMYRGVVMKPGAVIEHNKLFGDGTAFDSMLNTLRRTANDVALQKHIPVDRGLQRGIDVKNPDELLDYVASRQDLDPKLTWELIAKIEAASKNDVSPHIRELADRANEALKDIENKYNEKRKKIEDDYKKSPEKMKDVLENDKELKQMDKDIRFLKQESNRLELEVKLDSFVGRDLTDSDYRQLDDKISDFLNMSTKLLTAPLLLKGAIASTFDAGPKLARLMEIYGESESPLNLTRDALSAVFYTTFADTRVGGVIRPSANMKKREIEHILGYVISQEQAIYDMLGVDKAMDSLKGKDKKWTAIGMLDYLSDLFFAWNGIAHQNRSSFEGSAWIELRALKQALAGELDPDYAIRLFSEYGLDEADIHTLKIKAMSEGDMLDISKIALEDPLLHDKIQTAIAGFGFETTPRSDLRTNHLLDKAALSGFQLFGQTPKRSDSKVLKAGTNARRSLIRTGLSFLLNTHEIMARAAKNDPKKRKNMVLTRTLTMLGLLSTIAGVKQVLYDAMKLDSERGGANILKSEVLIMSFLKGATSFEYLGVFRDVIFNLLGGNWYSAAENYMGPVYSVYADAGYHSWKFARRGMDHWAEVGDWEDTESISIPKARRATKRALPPLNIPVIEAVTDKLIVDNMLKFAFPHAYEEWRENKEMKEERDLENMRNIIDSGDYFKAYYQFQRGKDVD
jgi:hypothetical protein